MRTPRGERFTLSAGIHNDLIREIVESFAPRYTPGGVVLYVGDTADKSAFRDDEALAGLGVRLAEGAKTPDVVIHYPKEDWLVLVEAVTSHGPIDARRRGDLSVLFANAQVAGHVYVTAFLTRTDMTRWLADISWETEVWVAEEPDHLIHFDGERFLGPYEA